MEFLDCFDFEKPLSLYIHIPFCRKKCFYCAFYSVACRDSEIMDLYTDKVVKEIKDLNLALNGRKYYTAFIGGGNPGMLSFSQLEKIAKAVCENGVPDEFSIEFNPESILPEHTVLFRDYFTRLSVGVQSLSERALCFLGRNSSLKETREGLETALEIRQKTGILLNTDIITCLPSWHDTIKDLETIIRNYSPGHISLYALTLEEGTALFKARPELPDSDKQAEQLLELWNFLEKNNYVQYEVSNFAKKNNSLENYNDICYSMHNSVYWSYNQYAGIGSSSASTGFKNGRAYRIEACSDICNYKYDITQLTKEEELEEFVLMGFRHKKGLSLNRLKTDFGIELKENSIPQGYRLQDNFLIPDKDSLLIADAAALEFLSKITEKRY